MMTSIPEPTERQVQAADFHIRIKLWLRVAENPALVAPPPEFFSVYCIGHWNLQLTVIAESF